MAQLARPGSVSVLGPLQLDVAGEPVRLRPAQRRVLAILLLDLGIALDREVLLDRMWPDEAPATAATALQVHLTGIRKAAPGLVVSSDGGYCADLGGFRFDRAVFEHEAASAVSDAAAGHPERVLRATARAKDTWRGAPYEELRDDEYAAATRARLFALWDQLTDLRVRALLALGRSETAIVELRELVQLHPLREPLWEHLMLALHLGGRQAEALQAFQDARRVLAVELGVEPGTGLRELEERIANGDSSIGSPDGPVHATNLPVVTSSFVGREDELRQVAHLLDERRLVTIVGEPGIGKTRLAIEAGHSVLRDYPDGAWFVPLAESRTAGDVASAIAKAVGSQTHTVDLAVLADRLAGRRLLLVLDNCEHVVGHAALFARQLTSRPGTARLVATSRRMLGLPDEAALRVMPLPAPSAESVRAHPGPALDLAATRLFVDRARTAERGFRPTEENAPLIAALCRRADGIPLALELAAAWIPALGLADVESMLGGDEAPRRGQLERPSRHRSLRAAMEWSIALLAPDDRDLFDSMSVFRGTCSLDDVVGICAPARDRRRTAAGIARLVDASLLVAERRVDGRVVYRSLVPIREFARERMEGHRDWEALQRRFVSHYLEKARSAAPTPFRAVVDLALVDDDLDNLREAFTLGLADGRADAVARAIVPLDGYFLNRFLAAEERDWLAEVLPRIEDRGTRAAALLSAAMAAQATNDLDEARRLLDEAVAAFRALDDQAGLAKSLLVLAGLHSNRGEWDAGAAAAREGLELPAAHESASGLGLAAYYLGTNLAYGGHTDEGVAALAAAAGHFLDAAELGRASQTMSTLTYIGVFGEDEALARRWADRAVELAEQSGSAARLARALSAAGALEARWGDPALARERLLRVDGLLHAQANEDIFEFLLPAGCLARREEHWSLLRPLVRAVEAAIVATGQGYAEPWRSAARRWEREAGAPDTGSAGDPGLPTASIEALRATVRQYLAAGSAPVA